MSARRTLGGIIAAALLGLTASSADASTVRPDEVRIRGEASNGYRMEIGISPLPHGGGYSSVTFSKANGSVTYFPGRGSFTSRRIVADFAQLGRVSVRYRVLGPRVRGNCVTYKSRPVSVEGSIRIRGEGGFAQVRAERARGTADVMPRKCGERRVHDEDFERPDVSMETCRRDDGRAISYGATEGFSFLGGEALHSAILEEDLGRLSADRRVFDLAPTQTLRANRRDGTATVSPTGRFAGSATYSDGRIRGDLTVLFPGIAQPVALAPAGGDLAFDDFADECRRY